MTSESRAPRRASLIATTLLVALAYFVTGRVGLILPAFGTSVTLLWLPAGIAAAALLRFGFGCWPGVLLGALALGIALGTPWPLAVGLAAGNTLGPLLAAWALRRMDFHAAFDRKMDIVLLAIAAIAGALVSSGIGVALLSLGGLRPTGRLATWLIWLAGDSVGVIAAAPLVLASTRKDVRELMLRRGELAIWFGLTAAVTWSVFVLNSGSTDRTWALAFVPLPMVAWAALRFGTIGTSVAIIFISVGAVYGTALGPDPAVRPHPVWDVAVLWIYMVTAATLGWLISALKTAQDATSAIQGLIERALGDVSLGMLVTDLDRRITYVNQGFLRLTGYSEGELIGRSWPFAAEPTSDSTSMEKLRSALHGDGFFDDIIPSSRKDGTTFWNALLVSPVRDERGALTGHLGVHRDVSSNKKGDDALRESEEHLRTIVELEPECVKLLSRDGRLLEMNPAGLAMIEAASLAEVRDIPITELIVPEDRAAFVAMHLRVIAGETAQCEFSIRGLKGMHRQMETHAVPYRNARHEIVGALAITRDVSERKEAAAELERSLATLQLLINTVPAYISFVDAEERYRLVNRRYEAYFGLPADQIVGRTLRETQATAAYEEMAPHVRAALAGRSVRYQSNPVSPDGTAHWFDVQYVPRRGDLGAVSGFFVIVFDITEEKQAELALRESEERYRALARFAPVGIFRADREGHCLYVNNRWCDLAGLTPERAMGMGWIKALDSEDRDRIIAEWNAAAIDGRDFQGEFRFRRPNGRVTWVHGSAVPSLGPDGAITGFLGSVTDLTERKRAEEERRQLDAHMLHTQKLESLGVLAGGIAHDFNNLLTSVLGNASIAAAALPPSSPVQECVAEITEASLRAADLCKQMLAYSGRGRFVVQTLDLGQLVEQTARMLKLSISKSAELRFQFAPELPPVEIDATQLRQVIMNLVINASEAIGDADGVVRLTTGLIRADRAYLGGTVTDATLPEGDYVYLEVSDNGCGMSPETQARVFDPFFTTKFTGRGLGLAAALGILRGHKGAIKLYSEVGRGTTFKILLPVAGGERDNEAVAPAVASTWYHEGTVLVVDDEARMRSTLGRMLRLHGLEVVPAADGRAAVELFRSSPERFALVLLDLTMPHMDGEQAFAAMHRQRPDVPVVLMSGFDAREATARFAGKGLAGFLQKPFSITDLRAILQRVLD